MSPTMRILLLVSALLTAGWILYKIRKLKVKMEDAIFWVIFAGILSVLGLFPGITYRLTDVLGIMSPANLIFLVIIFLLLEKVFTLSIIVSQLEEKITVLSAEVALRYHSADERLNVIGESETGQAAAESSHTDGRADKRQTSAGSDSADRRADAAEKPDKRQPSAGSGSTAQRADAVKNEERGK